MRWEGSASFHEAAGLCPPAFSGVEEPGKGDFNSQVYVHKRNTLPQRSLFGGIKGAYSKCPQT